MRTALVVGLAFLSLTACSTAAAAYTPQAATPGPTPSQPAPAQSPSPFSVPGAIAPPADIAVPFAGLPAGAYPVHVHSRCNGGQAFHIITIGSLAIRAGGNGSISIPRGYFGRGLCVIVYTNSSLSRVLTTRPI